MNELVEAAQRALDATEASFATWADIALAGVEERLGVLDGPFREEVRRELERRLRAALLGEVQAMAEAVQAMER